MKRFLSFLIILTLSFFVFAPQAIAKMISSETAVTVAADEVIDDDLFVGAETLTVEGVINGDLYAAAGTVMVKGIINGDVLLAGGTVNISGMIEDDVYVGAGNVNIQGASIGDSLVIGAGNVNVDEMTTIGGSLIFGAGSLVSEANVTRGMVGGAGMVNLNSSVGKDAYLGAGSLSLGSKAKIGGDLFYSVENEIQRAETASISGEVREIVPETRTATKKFQAQYNFGQPEQFRNAAKKMWVGWKVFSYLSALVVGVLILYLLRQPSEKIVAQLEKNFLPSLGWGLLVLILAGPVLLLLMITAIGLPLALILLGLFMIELYVAKVFVGIALGNWLGRVFKRKFNPYLGLVLGLALYYLLKSVPFAGFFVRLVGLLVGFGALFVYKKNLLFKPAKKTA